MAALGAALTAVKPPALQERYGLLLFLKKIGRGDWIRTSDSCLPKTVLYQAELHPENGDSYKVAAG